MKPIYFSSSSLQNHIWICNCPDVYQASLNFRITTSTNISAHEYLEAFAACFDRLKLSLPQGRREYSVISWSILTGRRIQTTRPDIKRTVSNINEEPKRLLPNCQFRYFYNEFITKPEYCFDVQLLINYKFRKVFVEMLAQFKTNAYLCTVISFKGGTSLLLI